jgi:cytochrome P450
MASVAEFTPPYSVRVKDWPNPHLLLIGKRSRDAAYGWPEQAFEIAYKERWLLGSRVHSVSNPDFIGHVMLHNHENYAKPDFIQLILKTVIGRGLLTAEGALWRAQRKIVAPTFAPSALTDLHAQIADSAARQIATWPGISARLDMAEQANATALKVISDALFSGDVWLTSPDAITHLHAVLTDVGKPYFTVMFGLPGFSVQPSFWRAKRGRKFLRHAVGEMVDERVAQNRLDDFFGAMIRSLYDQFPATEARALAIDNALTFYVAGHETTSVALAWTSYLLAEQPELQEQARTEAIAALSGDPATLPERLPLLRQIIEESMRLYPPLHRIERQALGDDAFGDVKIKKGDIISIWPMVVHRHRALWDRPDVFDHTRFAPEAKAKQHRFQFIPFGVGPRICVGARMAMAEAVIVMAHWLAVRRFELVNDHTVRPVAGITLRPAGGMPLMVSPL